MAGGRHWLIQGQQAALPARLPFRPASCWPCHAGGAGGAISESEPAIMDRLGVDAEHWLYITQNFESEFKGIVGAVDEVKSNISLFLDDQRERSRTAGIQACKLRLS